jgi:acetyl-CoA synthetase
MDENTMKLRNQVTGSFIIKFPGQELLELFGVINAIQRHLFSTFQANISLATALCVTVGYYRITGRVDDVVIVSGHNLGQLLKTPSIDTSGC